MDPDCWNPIGSYAWVRLSVSGLDPSCISREVNCVADMLAKQRVDGDVFLLLEH